MFDFLCLFNAAELLSASSPSPGQPTVLYVRTIWWAVKQFIEWLFQYIAPGRLCPLSPMIPTYCCAFFLWALVYCNWISSCTIFFWSSSFASFNAGMWGLFGPWLWKDCILISISNICFKMSSISLFKLAWVHPPSAIVKKKVTNRLTPVCWQAFDVAHIWVKANIISRSTQAQLSLVPHLKPGISMYLYDMLDNIKGCFAWFNLDLMFTLTQILTTSKTCQQTGVNLFVIFFFTMEAQAAALRKQIE